MQDDVLAYHLAKSAFVEEKVSKSAEVVEGHVFLVGPIEGEFVAAVGIVGKVARVHAVADDEQLDVIEQSVK